MIWLAPAATSRALSPIQNEKKPSTAGMRARLPANTKKQANVSEQAPVHRAQRAAVQHAERGGHGGDGGGDGHDAEHGQ